MKPSILLLDPDPAGPVCVSLQRILSESFDADFKLHLRSVAIGDAGFGRDLTNIIARVQPSIVFLTLPASSSKQGVRALAVLRGYCPQTPVIAVVESSDPADMLDLLRNGASDFITPPLKAIDVVARARRLLDQAQRQNTTAHAIKQTLGLRQLVGESPRFVAEVNKFHMVARCDAGVLLLGETGTGKELCARAIHYLSPRASKPFVPVNCGAIPVELVENELFGHEREAFTGAASTRMGLINEADGGTLFMDEIDCLPLLAQVKLLRFLQEKEYRPLGSAKMHQADVRVMAATNVDLDEAVKTGKLRQDLYYRLNVIPLALPPLRERLEDIPLLARHFLAKYAGEFEKPFNDFSESAMRLLLAHEWPGNVRELEHVVQRAAVMCEGTEIGEDDISLPRSRAQEAELSFRAMKARVIAHFERTYLDSLLKAHNGNISRAARAARKDPRALRQLIRKHKIDVQNFKADA